MTTIPEDEVQAKAARNLAIKAKANVEAGRVVFNATKTATTKAMDEARKTMDRAAKTFEALQHDAGKADAVAQRLEVNVAKRKKRDAEEFEFRDVNGLLAREIASRNNPAMKPEDYGKSINHLNEALRRMVG